MKSALPASVLALAFLAAAFAQSSHQSSGKHGGTHEIHRPADMKWQDGPPSLPAGAKFVVLEGDPNKEGAFTMRVRVPDGYRIPPHTHPAVEHVTVISGTFNLGFGDRFDQSTTQEMPAGSFGHWAPGMQHFAWVKGETTVQLHGIGPWRIDYVNPADDPRNKGNTGKATKKKKG
jgi:quercetin dioxygenase-like cupin family protein